MALLSVGFLDRRLVSREWSGISFIILGLAVVGLSDFISNNSDADYSRNNVITGDLLIITAQIITAVQMVYEERFVAGLDIPALQGIDKWHCGYAARTQTSTNLAIFYLPL